MGSGQNWFVDKWVKLCRRSECRQVRHSYLWFYGDLCAHCNSLVLLSGWRQLPNGVCWCLVPTQLIQIIETGNNKIKKSLVCFFVFFLIMYVVCVDLSKCREVLFQGSMFMMYTACAGWFLYTTCLQGALYTNPQSFCMLFAFLLTALSEEQQDFFGLCWWGRVITVMLMLILWDISWGLPTYLCLQEQEALHA